MKHSVRMAAIFCALLFSLSGCGGGGGDQASVYATKIIFSDSFSDGVGWQTRWPTPIDETPDDGDGIVANWVRTTDGRLRQVNNLERRAILADTSYQLGTFVALDPSVTLLPSSYFFSTDIYPLPDTPGTKGGNDVGVLFGYIDQNRYYRVSMNARYGFTRFEKRTGDTFQTLAVNSRGYVDDQPMTLAAEVNGNTIVVWIDGEPVFSAVDPAIFSGTVALYCQDRAEFDNVRITENPLRPRWPLATPLAYSVALTRDAGIRLPPKPWSSTSPLAGGSRLPWMTPAKVIPGTDRADVYSADLSGLMPGNMTDGGVERCGRQRKWTMTSIQRWESVATIMSPWGQHHKRRGRHHPHRTTIPATGALSPSRGIRPPWPTA